jgi:hypothetical protein
MVSDLNTAPIKSSSSHIEPIKTMQNIFVQLKHDAANIIDNKAQPFQRPFIEAKMCQETIKVLYDTGANISAINENIFQKISIDHRPQKIHETSPPQLRSAGSNNLQVCVKYLLPIYFGEKCMEHPFYIINNLIEQAILGIDFIQHHSLTYCPDQRKFSWKGGSQWNSGTMKLCSMETIPPFTVVQIRVQLTTENGCVPNTDTAYIANITVPDIPVLTGGPALVQPNKSGQTYIRIANCSPNQIVLQRGEFIGLIKNVSDSEKHQLDPTFVTSLAEKQLQNKVPIPLSNKKKTFIQEKSENIPEQFKENYLNILYKNHEAISEHKYDLGKTETLMHNITLKSEEPVYVKQFKIPDAHRQQVEQHVTE